MRAVPLTALGAGDYRLEISLADRVSGRSATADTTFSIVEPAPALLAKAPPLAPPLQREDILGRDTMAMLLDAMAAAAPPGGPSAQLDAAMRRARAGEFGALLGIAPASSAEVGAATLLRGLALLALNETPAAALALFQSVLDAEPGHAAAAFLVGACHGLQRRDAEAATHWEAARQSGLLHPHAAALLAAAHLRAGRPDLALARLDDPAVAPEGGAPHTRLRGGALHAAGRDDEAVHVLLEHLGRHPDDGDARFLLLRIWFGAFARETGSTPGSVDDSFLREARTYVADARAPHAPLVWEWLKVVERTAAEARDR
jgi:tetratricopeptide (TPR) repeat protein